MFETEKAFYEAHQIEYRKQYLKKWLVIKGSELLGVFNTPRDAVLCGRQHGGEDDFMLRRPLDDDMTLEVGPFGIIKAHRPYDTEKSKPTFTMTTTEGEPVHHAYGTVAEA